MAKRPEYFYYNTIKKIITTFGLLFRDIVFEDDFKILKKVPIHYLPKEKFLEIINHIDYDDGTEIQYTLPQMGFELNNIEYDSSRMLNPMSKISKDDSYMLNRIPYDFPFTLYLASRKFEESLKIVEQILPFFTPELNVSIKDHEQFDIISDIPFILNSSSFTIEFEGSFETKRNITWTFEFIAKGWLYSNIRSQKRIKETIVKMENKDFNKVYESFISYVEPRFADKFDEHQIIDKIYSYTEPINFNFIFYDGYSFYINSEIDHDLFVNLDIMPINSGSNINFVCDMI